MLTHANIARELLFCFLFAYFLVSKKVFRSAINPLSVAIAPWAAIIGAQEFLQPSMYLSSLAAAIIALCLLSLGFGAFVALVLLPANGPAGVPARLEPVQKHRWLRYCVFVAVIGGVLVHVGITFYYGFILGFGLTSTGTFVSYTLFDQVLNSAMAWPYRIATSMVQIGALICSLELRSIRPSYILVSIYLALVSTEAIVIANRQGMFLAWSTVAIGWVVFSSQRYKRVSLRLVLAAFLCLVVAALLYGYTTTRRLGKETEGLDQKMASGLISSPSVLTGVLADREEWVIGTLRGDSYRGLMIFVTGQQWDSWVDDAYPVAPDSSETSNMVTGLWQLLSDFGIIGTFIILALIGAATTWIFYRFNEKPTARRSGILICIYLFLAWLPIFVVTHYMYFWVVSLVALKIDSLYSIAQIDASVGLIKGQGFERSKMSKNPSLSRISTIASNQI